MHIMKKMLLASAAAAMLIAAPAAAAPSDGDEFNINGSVADACTMENINDVNLGNLPINLSAGPGALLINGPAAAASNSFYVSCNDTNLMTVDPDAGRLVNQDRTYTPGVDDAGFKDTINYTVTALNYRSGLLAVQPGYSSILGAFGQTAPRGAVHRQVTMAVAVTALGNLDGRPLAGNYQDTVTVTVSAL
jgi:spore coat protein U-like protein